MLQSFADDYPCHEAVTKQYSITNTIYCWVGRIIGKQAKVLSGRETTQVLSQVKLSRYPERNEVMVLLSLKAGLRAKEISLITWSKVTDASGEIGEVLHLPHQSSKGKSGRIIPLNKELKRALTTLYELVSPDVVA